MIVTAVDHSVFDLQPEVCGVVGFAVEDLLAGEVGRHLADGLHGCRDGPATGERLIAERTDQYHVLGDYTGEGVLVGAAVHALDEGLDGGAVRG